MRILLYLICIVLILNNIIKNKKIILTMCSTIFTILVTYIFNIKKLSYLGGIVGINVSIFALLGLFFMILIIFAKLKYKLKERNISFIFIILLTMILYILSRPFAGGLMLEGEEYFYYNLDSYLAILPIIIINVNLCVNFLSQNNKTKRN